MPSRRAHAVLAHLSTLDMPPPVILIGYAVTMRSTSPRGGKYAITHMVISPSRGQYSSNIEQLFMRCAGTTKALRVENGFGSDVIVLCDRSDLAITHGLFAATQAILERAGTGSYADLVDALRNHEYENVHKSVIECMRRHMMPGMREQQTVGRIRFRPEPASTTESDDAPSAKRTRYDDSDDDAGVAGGSDPYNVPLELLRTDNERVLVHAAHVCDTNGYVTLETLRKNPVVNAILKSGRQSMMSRELHDCGWTRNIAKGTGQYMVLQAGFRAARKMAAAARIQLRESS